MPYKSCRKHPKIKWNGAEQERCPVCVYGTPDNQPREPKAINLPKEKTPEEKEMESLQKRARLRRQIEAEKKEAKQFDSAKKFVQSLPPEVLSPSRQSEIVEERMKAIVILKENYGQTYSAIGRLLHKDHTSIIHLMNKYMRLTGKENGNA